MVAKLRTVINIDLVVEFRPALRQGVRQAILVGLKCRSLTA